MARRVVRIDSLLRYFHFPRPLSRSGSRPTIKRQVGQPEIWAPEDETRPHLGHIGETILIRVLLDSRALGKSDFPILGNPKRKKGKGECMSTEKLRFDDE
jgi:hypothetical protein